MEYISQNVLTNLCQFHTKQSETTFDTALGQNITEGMHAVARAFNLDDSVGIAPHDFNYDR